MNNTVATQDSVRYNQALDADPPVASFLESMLIGGGAVNACVRCPSTHETRFPFIPIVD